MLSDKGTYTLYFRNANTLYSTELVFIGGFQLRKECKEFCLNYGYPAKKDEAKHLADITKQIPLFGEQKKVTCLQVPSFKYSRLLDEPNTRIIPGYGICRNDNCKPQFEKCIACESFSPDPACRDFFSAAIDLLSKRNQQIIKRHGDSKVLTHNEEMIRLYKKCLARIESNLS